MKLRLIIGTLLLFTVLLNAAKDPYAGIAGEIVGAIKKPNSETPPSKPSLGDEIIDSVPDKSDSEPGPVKTGASEETEKLTNVATDCTTSIVKTASLTKDALPLIDWLNSIHRGSFFNADIKSTLCCDETWSDINSLNEWSLFVEPYAFWTNFDDEKGHFKLRTLGFSLGGGYNLKECLVAGFGAGYAHSNFHWTNHYKNTHVNTVYFGPYLGLVIEQGHISLELLGRWNSYDVNRSLFYKGVSRDAIGTHTGWDFEIHLEGTKTFCCNPKHELLLSPLVQIDYIAALSRAYSQDVEKTDHTATISTNSSHFLRTNLALQLSKEYCRCDWALTPSITAGWVHMQPMSDQTANVKISGKSCTGENKPRNFSSNYESSNLFHLGLDISGVHKRGVLLGLGYEGDLGGRYATHAIHIRIERDW